MALPTGTAAINSYAQAGVPVGTVNGQTLWAPLLVSATTDGSASGGPTAGTDLSGTVTTTSGAFNIPASTTRKPGDVQGQNVGTVNIGFNEFNGTAVIGNAGTYVVAPGGTFSITTNRQVNFVASANNPVTITSI